MPKRLLSILTAVLIVINASFSVYANTHTRDDVSSCIEKIISYKMESLSVSDKDEFISIPSYNTDSVDNQWFAISLSKYGYDMSVLAEPMQATALKLYEDNAKATDFQRVSIALSSCGVNPQDVRGKNILADGTYNSATIDRQGINAYAYGLLALNCSGVEDSVDSYIDEILSLQLSDGGFALAGSYADPDVTAICIQALAPNRNNDGKIKEAIEKALDCLSKMQGEDGGFSSYGTKNCESTAQVISALTALEIDPESDSRFIKNGSSTIDALLEYQTAEGGFSHISGGKTNSIATVQALKALVDYNEFLKAGSNEVIFDEDSNEDVVTATTTNNIEKNSERRLNESVDKQTPQNEEKTPELTVATENITEATQAVEKYEKMTDNSSYDEAFISDKDDNLIPAPTTKASTVATQLYSESTVFVIAISGLLIVFVLLLTAKLIIAKKNGEKFRFRFGREKGENDEDEN